MSETRMFHLKFPRLAELCDEAGGAESSSSVFRGLEEWIRQCRKFAAFYEALEDELSQLSDQAWIQLRRKCVPYVCTPHNMRGWEQLFSILNEAKGYMFLKQLGYVNIRFLSEDGHRTPDLEASGGSDHDVILEVKTLHTSDENYRNICDQRLHEKSLELSDGLASKFVATLHIAENQLLQYRATERLRRFAMLVVHHDNDPDAPFRRIDHGLQELARQHRNARVSVVIHRPYDVFILDG